MHRLHIQAWASALPSDLDKAMREASRCRTVTDTDSCAFSFSNQSNADEGMTEAHKHYTFMKKVFTKGLLLLVLLLCGVGNMQSQDFLYDGLWYTVLDAENKTCQTKSGHLLNGGNVVTGHLVLPSTVYNNGEAYTLTELGDYSFNGNSCDGLLSVELPNTLTRIGIMAFASATELESIVIPEGVKEIADGAFCACIILSDIRLPQSLEVIGAYAFQDIHSVTTVSYTHLTLPTNSLV